LMLYRLDMEGGFRFNLVHCVCPSTGREYYLRVPPNMTDAKQAIAWTFYETSTTYRPFIET